MFRLVMPAVADRLPSAGGMAISIVARKLWLLSANRSASLCLRQSHVVAMRSKSATRRQIQRLGGAIVGVTAEPVGTGLLADSLLS